MSCEGAGSVYEQWKSKKLQKLQKANRFKNKFIKLWEKYGTFYEENGKKYFKDYKIMGDGDGEIAMSKLLGQPNLHSDVYNHKLKYVDIILNFSKMIELTDEVIEAFKTEYIKEMKSYSFDALYYKFSETEVVDSYFKNNIYDEENNKIGEEQIESDFLDELAWEIAERARTKYEDYGNPFPSIYDESTGITTKLDFIIYDEEVTDEDIENSMNSLYDAFPNYDDYGDGTNIIYRVPSIYEKIREYAVTEEYGVNVLDDLTYTYRLLVGGYAMSVADAKRMNGVVFVKLLTKVLDFKAKTKSKYRWLKALVAILTFVIAAILIATGNVAMGVSLLLSFAANVTGNKYLLYASYIAAMISMNPAEGFFNLTYMEAAQLVLNIASLYFSMQMKPSEEIEQSEDTETAQTMLYDMPYDMYDEIYCFDELLTVKY